jgi:hypothetical protein
MGNVSPSIEAVDRIPGGACKTIDPALSAIRISSISKHDKAVPRTSVTIGNFSISLKGVNTVVTTPIALAESARIGSGHTAPRLCGRAVPAIFPCRGPGPRGPARSDDESCDFQPPSPVPSAAPVGPPPVRYRAEAGQAGRPATLMPRYGVAGSSHRGTVDPGRASAHPRRSRARPGPHSGGQPSDHAARAIGQPVDRHFVDFHDNGSPHRPIGRP